MAQSGGMGDVLKYGLLAVGGYLLYNWWTSQPAAVAAPVGGGTTSGGGTTGGGTTTGGTTGGGTTNTLQTPGQWNAVSTSPLTAGQLSAAFPNASTPITLAQFNAGIVAYASSIAAGTVLSAAPLAAQLTAAAGLSASATLNADQWSYYYARLPGHSAIDGTVFDSMFFPNGRPADASTYTQYTSAQFASVLASKGLNGFGQAPGPMYAYDPNTLVPGGPLPLGNPHIIVGRLPGGQFAGLGAVRIHVPRLIVKGRGYR